MFDKLQNRFSKIFSDIRGHGKISEKNISTKRPAPTRNVIPAKDYKKILGKRANKNIFNDRQLKWSEVK